jgi:hypothetical protein
MRHTPGNNPEKAATAVKLLQYNYLARQVK